MLESVKIKLLTQNIIQITFTTELSQSYSNCLEKTFYCLKAYEVKFTKQ